MDNSEIKLFVKEKMRQHFEGFFASPVNNPPGGIAVWNFSTSPGTLRIFWVEEGRIYGKSKRILEVYQPTQSMPYTKIAETILNESGDKQKWNTIPLREIADFLGLNGDINCGLMNEAIASIARHIDNSEIFARLPLQALIQNENKRLSEAGIGKFRDIVNPEVFALLDSVDNLTWKIYDYYSPKGPVGDIRRKAIEYYPMFAQFISDRISLHRRLDAQENEMRRHIVYESLSEERKTVLNTKEERNGVVKTIKEWMIEEGKDILPPWQLSEKFVRKLIWDAFTSEDGENKIPQNVITGFRGLRWRAANISMEKLVLDLAQLPPDWFPKNEKDWNAFLAITTTIGSRLRLPVVKQDSNGNLQEETISLRALYDSCAGKWSDFLLRLATAYRDTRPPEGAPEEEAAIVEKLLENPALADEDINKVRAVANILIDSVSDQLSRAVPRESWVAWLVNRTIPDASRDTLNQICNEVMDAAEAFSRKVLLPAAAYLIHERFPRVQLFVSTRQFQAAHMSAVNILFAGKSATRIVESVRQYINRAGEIAAAGTTLDIAEKAEQIRKNTKEDTEFYRIYSAVGLFPSNPKGPEEWEPLCPPFIAPNGIYVVPLTSRKELIEEGRGRNLKDPNAAKNEDGSYGLRICVGEVSMHYFQNCLRGGQHILSFRIPTPGSSVPFVRLGCLQLEKVKPGTQEIKNLQFRGPSNENPSPETMAAFEFFKGAIESGALPIYHDRITAHLLRQGELIGDEIELICGFPWRRAKHLNESMAPWGRFVSKKYKSMSFGEFIKDDAVVSIAYQIFPSIKRALQEEAKAERAEKKKKEEPNKPKTNNPGSP